jgi:hypothetical protein
MRGMISAFTALGMVLVRSVRVSWTTKSLGMARVRCMRI